MSEELIPIIFTLSILGGLCAWFYFRAKSRASEQETLRHAIDQGQTLSEEMVAAMTSYKPLPFRDLRRGLVLLAIGIAMIGFGWLIPEEEATLIFAGLSLFPLLLSFAYLAMHKFGLTRD